MTLSFFFVDFSSLIDVVVFFIFVDFKSFTMRVRMLKIEVAFNQFKIVFETIKTNRRRFRRRRNNDDQYENFFSHAKRRVARFKISNVQKCENWNNFKIWLRDCEEYIAYDFVIFSIEKFKTIWSTSLLITIKKNQWRNHVDDQFVKQT